MKEIKVSPGGYYYAEVTRDECLQWGGFGVCDLCNNDFDKGYLIWVLSDCICQSCFDDWMDHQTRYEEDLKMQSIYAKEWFEYHLGEIKMPEEEEDGKR